MKKVLWLDDLREPKGFYSEKDTWVSKYSPIRGEPYDIFWVKSYTEFIEWITKNGMPDAICFDHDLADSHYDTKIDWNSKNEFKEKTGHDCAKWLVEYCMDNNVKLPLYNIQSMNPVGKSNIKCLLDGYNKFINNNG